MLLTLPSADRVLAAAPEPQDVKSSSPARVLQTAPARTAQMQVCVREVPDLSRYNAGSASAVLNKFDLALGSAQLQTSTAPRGTIVGQSVKPGTQVRCGTRIDIYVSEGQQAPAVDCPVPNLTNHSYADVREHLEKSAHSTGKEVFLQLAEHKVVSTHRPHVSLMKDGAEIARVEFEVAIELALQGAGLRLLDGAIQDVQTGRVKGKGTVKCFGAVIVEKEIQPKATPGTLKIAGTRAASWMPDRPVRRAS